MNYEVRDARAFTSDRRCSQGPHEIELEAYGTRWGEEVEVYACSGHAIQGRWSVAVDGVEHTVGTYGEQRTSIVTEPPMTPNGSPRESRVHRDVERPQNERCVASEVELAHAGSPAAGAASDATPSGPSGDGAPAATATTVREELRSAPLPRQDGDLVCPVPGLDHYDLGRVAWWVQDPEQGNPLRRGARIRIRLWSDLPNDLEGVTFVVRHSRARPSVSDEEWAEHLREENREREQDWAEADRERAACERDPECAERTRRRRARDEAHVARRVRAQDARRSREPDGPPPAARAEMRPPSPSVNAEWIDGYWTWSIEGSTWAWISGRWRVPEADVAGGLTTRAPSAPPAAGRETPPPAPIAGAIWTAGHWQWDGRSWVWVAGSWQLPPSAGLRWQSAGWRATGGVFVFVPGGWIR